MKRMTAILILAACAANAGAAVLEDWKDFKPPVNVGAFTDAKGTKIDFAKAEGPETGDQALKMSVSLVEWGGVWAALKTPLTRAGSLRFKARASAPGILEVGLNDTRKVQIVALVRIFSDSWEEFVLPLSLFVPTKYPMPEAPKGAAIDLAKMMSIQFSPRTGGTTTYWVGPVSYTPSSAKARTGMPEHKVTPGVLVVQDFTMLDKRAYGVFTDSGKGSQLTMDVARDNDHADRQLASFRYTLKDGGWCGVWMRCGDEWFGQDWRSYKDLEFTVHSVEPLSLEFGFNDGAGNAYVALAPQTKGNGWETLRFPLDGFQLNPYWQPPEAKRGAPRDLSSIETFNIAPKTPGTHSLKVREVLVRR